MMSLMCLCRRFCAILLISFTAAAPAHEAPRVFSLASGYANGFYFMTANALGALISSPPTSLPCDQGGSCGVENLLLSNIASHGSVDNLQALEKQTAQSAFIQSDITYWAYSGTGLFSGEKPRQNLRAIASFYPEMLHLVVKKDSEIQSVSDLRGKRIALGAKNSGTLVNVRELLAVHGLREQDLQANYDDIDAVSAAFTQGKLDGFFFVAGVPAPLISHLAKTDNIRLIPIVHDDALYQKNYYYSQVVIPANAYTGVTTETPTVAVRALWVTTEEQNEAQIYALTKTLWQKPAQRPYWIRGLLPLEALELDHALDGIGIPLHSGAKRFYDEIGKRF